MPSTFVVDDVTSLGGTLADLSNFKLTASEIASLQQSKKSIADFVQKELAERMKQRHLEHMLAKV